MPSTRLLMRTRRWPTTATPSRAPGLNTAGKDINSFITNDGKMLVVNRLQWLDGRSNCQSTRHRPGAQLLDPPDTYDLALYERFRGDRESQRGVSLHV